MFDFSLLLVFSGAQEGFAVSGFCTGGDFTIQNYIRVLIILSVSLSYK